MLSMYKLDENFGNHQCFISFMNTKFIATISIHHIEDTHYYVSTMIMSKISKIFQKDSFFVTIVPIDYRQPTPPPNTCSIYHIFGCLPKYLSNRRATFNYQYSTVSNLLSTSLIQSFSLIIRQGIIVQCHEWLRI